MSMKYAEELGNKQRAEHAEDEPPLTVSERARWRELERELRELRTKTSSWGSGEAAAFLAREHR